jgi:4-hydroxy-2-oxoheptanedioate aldolase
LENTEEIAATEGIDGLFFGPDDISMQDGLPMDKPRETTQLEGYMRTVAGCAERYGKFAGITVPSMALYESALNMGYSFFVASGDVTLIASGSKAARRNYEEFEMKRGKEKSN